LNQQRERIAELLPGPVLLVLSDRAMNRFLADAPDLADWYVASFEFETTVAAVEARREQIAIPERSAEWIESRIALLRDQLNGPMRDRTRVRFLRELADLYLDSRYAVQSQPDQPRPRTAAESMQAAETELRKAIEIQRALVERDPSPTAERDLGRALNELGLLLMNIGRYTEAEPIVREALTTAERVLESDHPDTLAFLNNLATLYTDQGRYPEAEPLYRRALDVTERVFGKENPGALVLVNNLANLYEHQGRYAEAEPLCRRALETSERVLGSEHPDTLDMIQNLAALYKGQRRYEEAEQLYRRSLDGMRRLLGEDHPLTLIAFNNLASLYQDQGRYGEAETLYRTALAGAEKVLGPDHPDTRLYRKNLDALLSRTAPA
jgi:tetratricopeptide (TPR) repeat protein